MPLIASDEVLVNGVDLGLAYGVVLVETPTGLFGLTASVPSDPRADGWGTVVTGTPSVAGREVTLVFSLQAADAAALSAAVAAFAALWLPALTATTPTPLLIQCPTHAPGRQVRGLPTRLDTTLLDPQWARLSVTLVCADPAAEATSDTVVTLSTTAAACALGTAPSPAVLVVHGPCTHPTVEVRDGGGVLVASVAFGALTLAGGDTLTVDAMTMAMVKVLAGVTSSALGDRTSGRPLVLDPARGALTVRATGSVGAGSTLTYRQRSL